ncbi:hypothetical protein OF83DRAFT_1178560, partial [Amylostereum chailletii]
MRLACDVRGVNKVLPLVIASDHTHTNIDFGSSGLCTAISGEPQNTATGQRRPPSSALAPTVSHYTDINRTLSPDLNYPCPGFHVGPPKIRRPLRYIPTTFVSRLRIPSFIERDLKAYFNIPRHYSIYNDEDVQHLSNLRQLDTVQARLDYSARFISQEPPLLARIGISFYNQFEETGDPLDIETAIAFEQRVLDLTPEGDTAKPARLHNIGTSFSSRFERLGDVPDIDSAIRMQRQAVNLTPEGHADKPIYLNNLGISLMHQFKRLGDTADIDSAVRVQRQAVDLTPKGHANKPVRLTNLGNSFMRRFERLGDVPDVDSAIRVQHQAVDLTPEGHANKPMWLGNLGISAIRMQRQAVDLTPEGHANKPMYLNNLGISFRCRFERLGDAADIDSAIRVQREAVDLTPEGHANQCRHLNNLGNSFIRRFEQFGDVVDNDNTIREAIDLTPDAHANKPMYLGSHGISIQCRFERLGDVTDIDSAIHVQRQAVDLTPEGHAEKPGYLNNLGTSFKLRFERSGDVVDIDSAIHVQRQAVDLTPEGHAEKSMYLNNLGSSFRRRFKQLGDTVDFHAAVDVYKLSADSPSRPPFYRFHAAHKWAQLLSLPSSTSSPLEAYRVVIALVPRLIWLGSNLNRRYEELPTIAKVVTEAVAAAIAAGDLACALEWLEEGRCVVWGQMLQLRTPLDDLRAVDPALANDLDRASRALDAAEMSDGLRLSERKEGTSEEDMTQQYRRIAEEYEQMVEKARALPGYEDFLRPKRLAHFRAAADSGPVVVVNINKTRCDALILLQRSDVVLHVPLPTLNHEDVAGWKDAMLKYLQRSGVRARGMRQRPVAGEDSIVPTILANLWSKIVQPVLFALGESSGNGRTAGDLPHLTWCATGPLAFLPLHAAGIYDKAGGPKVFDYVVSSYTSTLSALVEAGTRARNRSPTPSVLAVSQVGTGPNSLPGTVKEIEAIQKIVGNDGLYLDREGATKDSVLTAMADHNWIHLACHARQNIEDPTKSAFILHNSQLDLLSIMQHS